MKKYNSTELIDKANKAFENIDKSYGFDKSSFFQGYVVCYAELVRESNDIQNVMICRNCGSKNTYKCRVTDVIVCKDCDYQD